MDQERADYDDRLPPPWFRLTEGRVILLAGFLCAATVVLVACRLVALLFRIPH